MTPYYDEQGITIYHADCRDVLPTVAADVVLTDLPYAIDLDYGEEMVDSPEYLTDLVLNASTLERDRLRDDLIAYRKGYERAKAEAERLRVIVDLACAAHEAFSANAPLRDWASTNSAFVRVVRAEVTRRAAAL